MMNAPVSHDIPLPLPAPAAFLKVLLVVSFIAHILFVNLMVGGTLLTLFYEWRGRANRKWDRVAFEIARTVTVNKSLAVVLGVAPLLLINVLYTVWFYSSNALTGTAWIMIIPLVIAAFLLTYLHQYSWERLRDHKAIHLSIVAGAAALFLMVPLIFLVNINLMLFPERWLEVHGFFSALALPNVFPRYFHFLLASIAVTAIFLVGWASRKGCGLHVLVEDQGGLLRKEFYSICLVASAAQFLIGPVVLMTLPSQGLSFGLLISISCGVALAIPALLLIWKEIQRPETFSKGRYASIVLLLFGTVLFMASGRHLYRETALRPHQEAMRIKTEQYQAAVESAKKAKPSFAALDAGASAGRGKKLFQTCSACHALDHRVVGPPLFEIARIYAGNPSGIVAWAKAPGKKRPDFPQMPAMSPMFSDSDLLEIANYILDSANRGAL
ncbi:MAG: c-type cytochrome [Oligoflexia bacterium]|nr:c-type cytochrome [Oligoflexia bacterium]